MNAKPEIKIDLSPIDRLIEIVSWIVLLILWALAISKYSSLPDAIPTHFNIAGTADRYGSRSVIFLLPIVGTILSIGLTIINKHPEKFRYLRKITQENAVRHYTNATRMVRYVKVTILISFVFIVILTVETATAKSAVNHAWRLPALFVLILTPILFFTMKSLKWK
jgi:uncharacterized membrane protein